MHALLSAVVSIVLLAGASANGAELTREQAIRGLSQTEAQARRDAAERLGVVGTMADAKALVNALRDVDANTRERAEQALWRIWARSGDAEVDALYQTGIEQMNAGDVAQAIDTFSRIIERKPDYAEGWNRRATLYFLAGDLHKSLADCDEVIKRNPYHFGALAGYAQIYVRLEYYERALEYARKALAINPNLDGMRQSIPILEHILDERRKRTV